MNLKNLLLLSLLLLKFSSYTMERCVKQNFFNQVVRREIAVRPQLFSHAIEHRIKQQDLVNQIIRREITFQNADSQIDMLCNGNIKLKAYARAYLKDEHVGNLNTFLELHKCGKLLFVNEQLMLYRKQALDTQDQISLDIVDLAFKLKDRRVDEDPFITTSDSQNENGARFLLSLGLQPTHAALNVAVCRKNFQLTMLLIDVGVPLNPDSEDSYSLQRHPLLMAAKDHDEKMVELLVKAGTNLDKKYKSIIDTDTGIWEKRTVYEQIEYELNRCSHDKPRRQKALEILRKYCNTNS